VMKLILTFMGNYNEPDLEMVTQFLFFVSLSFFWPLFQTYDFAPSKVYKLELPLGGSWVVTEVKWALFSFLCQIYK
jgi:hypothetical protein